MLNDQLLEAFIGGFYGYGDYLAPYWFIGMEEAGGEAEEDVARQLEIWDGWGREELLDVAEYAREMGITRWHRERPSLQRTWKHLIRVALTAEGKPVTVETMREFQKKEIGTRGGDTCLLELLPLPSPSVGAWRYDRMSALPYLRTRKAYTEHIVEARISHFRDRVLQHQPKAVVFYGLVYDRYWRKVAGVRSWEMSPEGIRYAFENHTLFVSAAHPVARGATNQDFTDIGELIRNSGPHVDTT